MLAYRLLYPRHSFFFLFISPRPINSVMTPPNNPPCLIESPVSGNFLLLCVDVASCFIASDVSLNVD